MKNIAPSSIIGGGLRLHGVGPRVKPEDDAQCEAPRPAVHTAPGVALPDPLPAFALFDPFKRYGHPWLEDGDQDEERFSRETDRAPDEPVDATQLCRRIRALERALQDLDGQAARLARWRARRDRETCRPKRFSPMRPGRPPGVAETAENAGRRGLAGVRFPRPRRVEHVMSGVRHWPFYSCISLKRGGDAARPLSPLAGEMSASADRGGYMARTSKPPSVPSGHLPARGGEGATRQSRTPMNCSRCGVPSESGIGPFRPRQWATAKHSTISAVA